MRAIRRTLMASVILATLAGFHGANGREAEGTAARTAAGRAAGTVPGPAPTGGMDLQWCLTGITLYHAGGLVDADPVELAGALLTWLACR